MLRKKRLKAIVANIGFVAYQIATGCVFFTALIITSFALKDGFCLPNYWVSVQEMLFALGVIMTPFLAVNSLILSRVRTWIFALLPLGMALLALVSFAAAEYLLFTASREFCSQSIHLEVTDHSAPTHILTAPLKYAALLAGFMYFAFGFYGFFGRKNMRASP